MADTRKQPYTLLEQQLNEMARRMALDVNEMSNVVASETESLKGAIQESKAEVETFISEKNTEVQETLTQVQTNATSAVNKATEDVNDLIESVSPLQGEDYEIYFINEYTKTGE